MGAQRQLPGGPYVDETNLRQAQIPGGAYVNETQSSAAGVPGPPTGVSALSGNNNAQVTFNAPNNNGGSPITGYRATASSGEFAVGTESPIVVTVPNGVLVTFTVVAINAVGDGAASTASNEVVPGTFVMVVLGDSAGVPAGSLTNLKWAWFDESSPELFNAPTDQGSIESTDGSGILILSLLNSVRNTGEVGWLVVTNSNGSVEFNHKAFSGPATVS